MKIILFGATGGTGLQLLEQALSAGHELTVFCRYPDKIKQAHARLRIIQGDVLAPDDTVTAALSGQDAVICALGLPNIRDQSRLRTRGTQAIIRGMEQQGIQRLICLSAFGAGDSLKFMPFHYRYLLVPVFMKALYDDHNQQEKAIRASQLAWTIVRPAILHNGKMTGNYQHGTEALKDVSLKISRANVAAFMLAQLVASDYLYAAPTISE
jgi:putative NADH-flavin reductase